MAVRERHMLKEIKNVEAEMGYDEQFMLICQRAEIDLSMPGGFIYFIDEECLPDTTKGRRFDNLTPDYKKILEHGLAELKYPETEQADPMFRNSYNNVVDGMILLVHRIMEAMGDVAAYRKQKDWLRNMLERPAEGFGEAIQRMLFVNQLFWQTDHRLVGLGAWDSLLSPYYEKERLEGTLDEKTALRMLEGLYETLHTHYEYKSNVLMGDTGQIFVLGKSDAEGNYICSELTYLLIEAMMNKKFPEPKCLLRVSTKTPRELLELALCSIETGSGAPLLANDEVIIPCLKEFGVESADALEYTTSACWEPLIGGKSTSLNNENVLNYLKALENMLLRCRLDEIENFEQFLERYFYFLKRNLRAIKRVICTFRYQYDPLLSVFTEGCRESGRDVSWGGAKYHNIGITTVAMSNLIQTLLMIKEYVFEKRLLSLNNVKKILLQNYDGYEGLLEELRARDKAYGTDTKEIIELVNCITACVAGELANFDYYLGGKIKFGLSGSAYLDVGRGFGASFDGRRAGEPFGVHISNDDNDGYTEVIRFAAGMNYGNGRLNGNVVDIMANPDLIARNREKFTDFMIAAIREGFFELQMNVVSSDILIRARENAEEFPNLIVRVWGFSAYFNDLPEEYKDVLIHRALRNEGKAC